MESKRGNILKGNVIKFVSKLERNTMFHKLLDTLMRISVFDVGHWDWDERIIEIFEFSEDKMLNGLEREYLRDIVENCIGGTQYVMTFRTQHETKIDTWSTVTIRVLEKR